MRDSLWENINRKRNKKKKLGSLHNLVDCIDNEMTDEEIAAELEITSEEVRTWREKYEE